MLDLDAHKALRLANDLFYASRSYERTAAEGRPRKSVVRKELEHLRKLAQATVRRRSREAAQQMESHARGMSRAAWIQCGSAPDEHGTYLHVALETAAKEDRGKLTKRQDYSSRGLEVLRIVEEALEVLPMDRGGPMSDRAARLLMEELKRLFQEYCGLQPRLNIDSGNVSANVFTSFALNVAGKVEPEVSQSKSIDYLKEALGYSSHPPR